MNSLAQFIDLKYNKPEEYKAFKEKGNTEDQYEMFPISHVDENGVMREGWINDVVVAELTLEWGAKQLKTIVVILNKDNKSFTTRETTCAIPDGCTVDFRNLICAWK